MCRFGNGVCWYMHECVHVMLRVAIYAQKNNREPNSKSIAVAFVWSHCNTDQIRYVHLQEKMGPIIIKCISASCCTKHIAEGSYSFRSSLPACRF